MHAYACNPHLDAKEKILFGAKPYNILIFHPICTSAFVTLRGDAKKKVCFALTDTEIACE